MLSTVIGERNSLHMKALDSAAAYVDSSFRALGFTPRSESYELYKKTFRNIEVTIPGTTHPDEIVLANATAAAGADGMFGAGLDLSGTPFAKWT